MPIEQYTQNRQDQQNSQHSHNNQNIDDELEQSLRGGVWDKLCGCVRLWFLTRFEEVIGHLYTRRYKVHASATDAKTNLVQAQNRLQETLGSGQIALAEQTSRLQQTVSQGQLVIAEQKVANFSDET